MKTLTSPITVQKDAEQSGWCEVYDFYLKAAIVTPHGTTATIRITTLPGGLSFFTPKISPEPVATQGQAATYAHWPLKRELVKGSTKFANDKLTIAASNVTGEYAQMLADVDWYDTPVVIRKVSTTLAGVATADDCVVIFSGQIDSAQVSLQQVQFTVSNDLGSLSTIAPRENMHQNCRFNWADDQCTAIRFLSENFKPKTCGSGSTTTRVKATYAGYTAQAVTADSTTDKVTLAGHTLVNAAKVRFGGTTVPGGLTRGVWYYARDIATNDFKVSSPPDFNPIDLTSNGTAVSIDSETGFTEDVAAPGWLAQAVTADSTTDKITLTAHGLANGDRVKFAAVSMPGGLTAGVWYFVRDSAANDFKVALTEGGTAIDLTSNGTTVTMDSTAPYGTDLVDALAAAAITASSVKPPLVNVPCGIFFISDRIHPSPPYTLSVGDAVIFAGVAAPGGITFGNTYYILNLIGADYHQITATQGGTTPVDITSNGTTVDISSVNTYAADQVRYAQLGDWRIDGNADWGTLSQAFWQIPDAQAGLANAALTPWIQFDFGSAKIPRVWRFCTPVNFPLEQLVRTIVFFSSTDAAAWTHEGYFELQARGGTFYDCLLPKASSRRYWRICVRSKWGETFSDVMLKKVRAYENGRHWWQFGQIQFDAATTTVALRNVARRVIASYSGEVQVPTLPAAPASGDVFTVERGCPRTFNGCAERRNTENFGGFLDLPNQTVIR